MNDSLVRGGYHVIAVGTALCSTLSVLNSFKSLTLLSDKSYSTCNVIIDEISVSLVSIGQRWETNNSPVAGDREKSRSVGVELNAKH